ncbi:proline-rich transmembrane protein 4-like isoform X2 [Sinocyclocheilus rhinocerous]|uniref:proline-rich transmembrane protein 4-like isoform X2 n=1 Tax=Sinocyclocheilus rhinocerous TaxID=307959 RepID=UPI0007B9A922|nr:PREDICTED: proline-rich transmembrane protein 4-like isoform X2 [Sinocyclocheilus rhinocerous]
MLLLRGTLVVFSLFTSVYGFFSGHGPKPTTRTKADSKVWGMSYIEKWKPKITSLGFVSWDFFGETKGSATTKVSPTFPEATTQDYTLSSEDLSLKYQPTATTFKELKSSTVQIGTLLPLKSAKLPIIDLPQLDRPEPTKLDQSNDLELWPPNNGQNEAKNPQTTTSQISKPETQTYTVSTAQSTSATHTTTLRLITETMSPYSDQTVPTDIPSTTSELTTQTYTVSTAQSTSTTQTITLRMITETMNPYSDQSIPTDTRATTSALTIASFQTAHFITPAGPILEVSTKPLTTVSTGITNTDSKPEWTPFKTTDKALDGFTWVEQTAGPSEWGGVQSFGPDPTPTLPAGGFAWEEGDKEMGKSADLTTQERHEELTTSASATTLRNTEMPTTTSEDWLTDLNQESALPDCNAERSGICSSSDTWPTTTVLSNSSKNDSTTTLSTNLSQSPNPFPAPPMFVVLNSDWNNALETWGSAWEAHIYGLGTVFCLVALASTLNLLCLPLHYPSGCGYFALVSLCLVAAGCTRAFALAYDAYGYQDRMTSTEASLLLYEAPFPCMTAAFGLVFLLLSMRSRMQLSYSAFQRPCFLACLVLLHFAAAFGPVALLHVDQQVYLFLSLISRGAFVALATFLSAAYFVFYCYVRADSKHIYHLNNTSPTPAERYNRCPFAESRDWNRAAAAVLLCAVFSLACAGLQLYAMLHALGIAGSAESFGPWPWWTFQFSCRVCEAVICLTLVLVVAQPVYCSDHLPQPGSCWTELLAAKSPIIPGSYQWTLSHQEKLAICDPTGHGETECLPLYTLVDDRLGSLNGLDLLYHSNRALAYRDLDLDLPNTQPNTGAPSVGSSCTSDSTADLRPPSPINLRRSIDEALFSESLFPMSLFSPLRPFTSSDRSLNGRETNSSGAQTLRDTLTLDPGLYRTSSCMEVLPQVPFASQAQPDGPSLGFPPSPSPSLSSSTCCSSPERWRGSSSSCSLYRQSLGGSSLVLCSSPEGHHPPTSTLSGGSNHTASSGHQRGSLQRPYRTLKSEESMEQQSEFDQSVQEEFISVCRQIDALSICSETIDL